MRDFPHMEVSVIIPAYNAERYLGEAIASVLMQTHAPSEVIIVDDGSTDRTVKVAERFGFSVKVERRLHAGIAATRNHGIVSAHSAWLAFLDSDDVWLPHKLERQIAALAKDRDAEIAFGGVEQFISPELNADESAGLVIPKPTSMAPHIGTMLTHRNVFERVGLLDEQLTIGEFIDWFSRARDSGEPMVTVPEIVLRRRWHRNNTTRGRTQDFSQLAMTLKRSLDRRRQSPPPS